MRSQEVNHFQTVEPSVGLTEFICTALLCGPLKVKVLRALQVEVDCVLGMRA